MAAEAPRLAVPVSLGHPPRRRRVSPVGRRAVAAVVAALVAGVAFLVLTGDRAGTQVAVAAQDIQAGQAFDPGLVRYVEVRVPPSVRAGLVATAQVQALQGEVAVRTITSGSMLGHSDFVSANAGPPRQVMSFPVDLERAVAGALRPGDRVDVIDGAATGSVQPSYVVVGAEVVAVGKTSGGSLGSAGKYSLTITVDSPGALRLAAAVAHGAVAVVRTSGPSTAVVGPSTPPSSTPTVGPSTSVASR